MQKKKNKEMKLMFGVLAIFFFLFLAIPIVRLLLKSFVLDGNTGFTLENYRDVLTSKGFVKALGNSFAVSSASAIITTLLAFFLAYTVHYTNVPGKYKFLLTRAAVLPMLLPTITYGFAIIYSFGKQGLLTKLFGRQLFHIYGYKDQYVFQTFGTSELGGKLMAEGTNLEADLVTMSTFYVDSAQEKWR